MSCGTTFFHELVRNVYWNETKMNPNVWLDSQELDDLKKNEISLSSH
jgi:hypothetical protein